MAGSALTPERRRGRRAEAHVALGAGAGAHATHGSAGRAVRLLCAVRRQRLCSKVVWGAPRSKGGGPPPPRAPGRVAQPRVSAVRVAEAREWRVLSVSGAHLCRRKGRAGQRLGRPRDAPSGAGARRRSCKGGTPVSAAVSEGRAARVWHCRSAPPRRAGHCYAAPEQPGDRQWRRCALAPAVRRRCVSPSAAAAPRALGGESCLGLPGAGAADRAGCGAAGTSTSSAHALIHREREGLQRGHHRGREVAPPALT